MNRAITHKTALILLLSIISMSLNAADSARVSGLSRTDAELSKQQKKLDDQLLQAAKRDEYLKVQKLLDLGADPNKQDKSGATALVYGAEHNNFLMVQKLLDARADVSYIRHQDGRNKYFAVAFGENSTIRDLGVRDGYKKSSAAKIDQENCLLVRLYDHVDPLFEDLTPLHLVAIYGTRAMVDQLLDKRADVNARSRTGFTPLMGVILREAKFNNMTADFNDDIPCRLLERGADRSILPPHVSNPWLMSDVIYDSFYRYDHPLLFRTVMDYAPFSEAELSHFIDNIEATLGLQKGRNVTRFVIMGQHDEVERMMVEKRIGQHQLMSKDKAGRNALLWAAAVGNLRAMKLLMEHGRHLPASVPALKQMGCCVGRLKARFGYGPKLISFNSFSKDSSGKTVFDLARRRGDAPMVNYLCDHHVPRAGINLLVNHRRQPVPGPISDQIAVFLYGAKMADPVATLRSLSEGSPNHSPQPSPRAQPESKESKRIDHKTGHRG